MNKKLVTFIFETILVFGIVSVLTAQTVEVREISVKKNRPDEIYHRAATNVALWIRDNEGLFKSLVLEDSYLETFKDNKGKNLISAHEEAIEAWKNKVAHLAETGHYVGFDRTYELLGFEKLDWDDDVNGFYLNIESWALPAEGARSLHIAGKISYMVALDDVNTEIFTNIILDQTKSFSIGEHEIIISDFEDYGDMYEFGMMGELPIDNVAIYDANRKWIGGVTWIMDGVPYIEIPKDYWTGQVTVEISYRNLKKLTVSFDEIVGLGF